MQVNSPPFHVRFEDDPAPPHSGLRSAATFTLVGLLTIGAVLLLDAHGISQPAPCGDTFVDVCMAFE